MKKKRLDILLVERGFAGSHSMAQSLIMAGRVKVGGITSDKPGRLVPAEAEIRVEEAPLYVSRGGEKLEKALLCFEVEVAGFTCADIGASTGGFTDCLLKHGATRVYAIDVGYGQLAWSLRQDPRVVILERTNIRYLEGLPEPVDLATIDVSFISLELVLPQVVQLLKPSAQIIALVKPQFEAARKQVGEGGVVKNPEVHRQVLHQVAKIAQRLGLQPRGFVPSPLLGPAGNVEFFVYLGHKGTSMDIEEAIDQCLTKATALRA